MVGIIILILVLLIAGICGWMYFCAGVVHVKYADVYLKDLPKSMEGTKLLYVSDLHVMATHTAEKTAALFDELQALEPDLLLLGGDYTAVPALEQLWIKFGFAGQSDAEAEARTARDRLFTRLAAFRAPLGKYAVAGNHDAITGGLRESMQLGGITLLENEIVSVGGAEKLYIAGLADWLTGTQTPAMAKQVLSTDCVVVLEHNPDAFPSVALTEAADGGAFCDLMLAGHTHNGQILLFGQAPFMLKLENPQYMTGWFSEAGVKLLVSNGSGTSVFNWRLNTEAQAHLITLYRAPETMPETTLPVQTDRPTAAPNS